MAFLLGAASSWAATYYVMTREKRLIGNVRRDISHLGLFHGLSDGSSRKTLFPAGLANDEEVLVACSWARQHVAKVTSNKPPVARLAAEIIICERVLELEAVHALRVLMRCKTLDELPHLLAAVASELEGQSVPGGKALP